MAKKDLSSLNFFEPIVFSKFKFRIVIVPNVYKAKFGNTDALKNHKPKRNKTNKPKNRQNIDGHYNNMYQNIMPNFFPSLDFSRLETCQTILQKQGVLMVKIWRRFWI